jgi:hypothetical protein
MSPCLLFPGHEGVQHYAGQCRVHLSRGRAQHPLSGQHTLDHYTVHISIGDQDPVRQDPHVFGPPGSGSISQRYGFGFFPFLLKVLSGLK